MSSFEEGNQRVLEESVVVDTVHEEEDPHEGPGCHAATLLVPVRVIFSTEPASGLLNHLSVVRELAARGHDVTVAVHGDNDVPALERLAAESPRVSVERAASPSGDSRRRWVALAADVRSSLDFLAFLDRRYNDIYRARARRRVPGPVLALLPLLRFQPFRIVVRRLLLLVDRAIPTDPELERYLTKLRPDVVLFTPYVGLRTMQVHYLRAAKALGLRTAICVKSWDNLSSKSALHPIPDRIFVWNETQRNEAGEFHGIGPERVVVTGAQCFDHWLTMRSRPRDEFAALLTLDPRRKFVLYTCCAPWAGQEEWPFLERWLRALRASEDEVVAGAAVLIRPHPKRADDFAGKDLSGLGPVVVWPRRGTAPVEGAPLQEYVDSITHSAAVVGLNTTAMIEAALLERPVLTVLDPEYRMQQQGTLHFRYLLEVAGGLLDVAETLDEHVRQLGVTLRQPASGVQRARAFTAAFLRPFGHQVAATPLFVDEIERLGRSDPAPTAVNSFALRCVRYLLEPLARRAARAG
jgi:hypothetical protein